jgi:hypothetical protein
MRRDINSSKLTKNYILSKVSQVTIFSTYLNLSDKIVQNCIDTGVLICSPLRDDIHPTCGFKYDNRGKLKLRDFAGFFWGDAFDVVALVMGVIYNKHYDISNREDFIKILRHITFTFKDIFYGSEKDINLINDINSSISIIKNKKPKIELVVREWNNDDVKYWKQFGIDLAYLNVNFVYPVEQYYIDRNINPQPKYFYKNTDPCYAYYLGKDRNNIYNIKLYFPYRDKSNTRFITNCNHLEGIFNLNNNSYDIIVLTKSTKDRLSIGNTIMNINSLYGGVIKEKIGIINIPHETYKLRQNEYDWLNNKLVANGIILSLMDNDRVGKLESKWLKDNFNITPILIPKHYNSKDFAEFINAYGIETVRIEILNTIKYINNYDRKRDKLVEFEETSNIMPF